MTGLSYPLSYKKRIAFVIDAMLDFQLPEYASQESRRASRASAIMSLLPLPPPELLPSGKWVGVLLGTGRHKIGGKVRKKMSKKEMRRKRMLRKNMRRKMMKRQKMRRKKIKREK